MRASLMTVRAFCALVGVFLSAACAPPPSPLASDAGSGTDGAPSTDAGADARDAFVVVTLDVGTLDGSMPDAAMLDDAASSPDAYVELADSGTDAYVAPMDAALSPDAYAPIDAAVPRDAFIGPDAYVAPTPAEISEWNMLLARAETDRSMAFVPGVSLAVVLHGRLAFAAGIGLRDVASSAPVTTQTLFHADSMSKMVLAATAMSLVRDGMLDLHAPITSYIPWFALASGYDASTITTEHLLTHTSGFPCDTIVQCGSAATLGPREAFFRGYPQPLWSPPGAVWDYSNTGFALASQVIVAAAGVSDGAFEQLVHDRSFLLA